MRPAPRGLQWAGPDPVSLTNQAVRYVPTDALTDDTDGDGKVDCSTIARQSRTRDRQIRTATASATPATGASDAAPQTAIGDGACDLRRQLPDSPQSLATRR